MKFNNSKWRWIFVCFLLVLLCIIRFLFFSSFLKCFFSIFFFFSFLFFSYFSYFSQKVADQEWKASNPSKECQEKNGTWVLHTPSLTSFCSVETIKNFVMEKEACSPSEGAIHLPQDLERFSEMVSNFLLLFIFIFSFLFFSLFYSPFSFFWTSFLLLFY